MTTTHEIRKPPLAGSAMWMVAALSLIETPAWAQSAGEPSVKIGQGTLRGAAKDGVETFKAIPYAKPPVGELRWQPPGPAEGWTGIRDARAPGPACVQSGALAFIKAQSEDCLLLNVWRPQGAVARDKLPVMVWIHGGGFVRGTSTAPQYDGSHIAQRGVIQITLNYRLGRLGFFAHPALTAEKPNGPLGNYGIMDQIAALRWVQANISAFGGDPANVTVFGESAGASSVNILMSLPEARGLFAKAIAQSSANRMSPMPLHGTGSTAGEGIGTIVAEKLGVSGVGPEAAKALRAIPAERLKVESTDTFGGEAAALSAGPMIDGVLIKEAPLTAFAAGREAKVPYLTGANSFESNLRPEATSNPEGVLAATGARDEIVAAYGGNVKTASQNYTTESFMVEPTRALARLHARNGQKAWMYYFSFVPPAWRARDPGLKHAGEIPYVFNTLKDYETTIEYGRAPPATPEDLPIAEAAISYWVAFAKHSDPGSAGGTKWPQLDPETNQVLEFGMEGVRAVPQFHKATLDLVERLSMRPAT